MPQMPFLENYNSILQFSIIFTEKEKLTQADIEHAFDKKVIGADMKSRKPTMEDLKITAVHEAGHTLVAYHTKEAEKIHKVTIIAKGHSGGHTGFIPSQEHFLKNSRDKLKVE